MYLIITSAIDISKALKESEEGVTASGEGPIEVDKLSEKDKERLKQELLQELLNSKGEDNHEKD